MLCKRNIYISLTEVEKEKAEVEEEQKEENKEDETAREALNEDDAASIIQSRKIDSGNKHKFTLNVTGTLLIGAINSVSLVVRFQRIRDSQTLRA